MISKHQDTKAKNDKLVEKVLSIFLLLPGNQSNSIKVFINFNFTDKILLKIVKIQTTMLISFKAFYFLIMLCFVKLTNGLLHFTFLASIIRETWHPLNET